MSIEVKIAREAGLLVWRLSGLLLPEEIVAAIEGVGRDPAFDRSLDELVLLDETVELHAFDPDTIKGVQQTIKASYGNASVRNVRSALVCPNERIAPILKLWSALAAADDGLGLEISIFPDEPAARAWLAAPATN